MQALITGDHMEEPDGKEVEDQDGVLRLLCENFQLFQTYSQHIQSQPHLFFCQVPRAMIHASWIPNYEVPLGILLMLWDDGKWLLPCPECYGVLYLIGGGGSVMSGWNRCWGICLVCGLQYAEARSFLQDIYKPAARLLETYGDNRPVMIRPDPQPWSWVKAPMYVPEPIPRRPIEPGHLAELIEDLQEFERFNHDNDGKDGNHP